MPYVYKLKCNTINKEYIGSRTKKGHQPFVDDFWKIYFTSSSVVKLLIDEYGVDDFTFEMVKEFDNIEDCIEYEDYLLRSIPKKEKSNYLNRNFAAGGAIVKNQTHLMITDGKIYLHFPRDIQVPDGWRVEWNFSPPSQKGMRTYINPDTSDRIRLFPTDNIPTGYIWCKLFNEQKKEEKSLLPKRIVWITDGYKNTKITVGGVPPIGWVFGKTVKPFKKDRKKRTSSLITGRITITNGTHARLIYPEDNIPDGWRRGHLGNGGKKTKGMLWITNGTENRRIHPNIDIPNGWERGVVHHGKNSNKQKK